MKKISRIAKSFALFASFCVPLFAAAQINTTYIKGYSDSITSIINTILVPVLIAIAFITFLWGVYKYFILGAADEKSRTDGRQFTLWGIIGFVIILSLWGIVNLFMGTLGLTASNVPAYPTLGAPSGSTGGTGGGGGGVDAAKRASCLGSGGTYNTSNNTCACASPKIWDGSTCTTNSSGGGGVDAAKRASCLGSGGTYNTSSNTCACSSPLIWDGSTCATNDTSTEQVNCENSGKTWSNGTCIPTNGTSCETTTVDGYPVPGTWLNGTCQ